MKGKLILCKTFSIKLSHLTFQVHDLLAMIRGGDGAE